MNKGKLKITASIVGIGIILVGCNPLKKMVKNYPTVKYELSPNPLEMAGDSIEINISGKFPPNYFNKKVAVEVTPVLKYPAESDNQQTKEFKALKFRGESVDGDGSVVNYLKGGGFNFTDKIPFDKKMTYATVELKAKGSFKTKSQELTAVEIGNGVITTPFLVKGDDKPILAKDNFTKVVPRSFNGDINYLINSSVVRPRELRSDDVKALAEVIKNGADGSLVFKNVKVEAYASPDGELSKNEGLADNRAKTAADAIAKFFKKAKIDAANNAGFYNKIGKGEDWDGFKKLMEASDIKDKELIIRILQMYSDKNKREVEIKNLAKTYLEVADKILPQLRRATIVVNAEEPSKTDEQIKQLAASNPDSLTVEELMYAAALTDDINQKMSIYQSVSKVYPKDWRGPNNVGYCLMMNNKLNDAKAEFTKADGLGESGIVKNNLGVVNRLMGNRAKAKELYKSASGAGSEVAYNMGIVEIMDGKYSSAVANLSGSNSFNEALAQLLNGDLDGALKTVNNSNDKSSAEGYYLKAIIGARKKDATLLTSNLKNATNADPSLKAKAKTDVEFINYWSDSNFKAAVN